MKRLSIFIILLILLLSSCSVQENNQAISEDSIIIGLSMAQLKTERWTRDRDFFVQKAEELGANVIVMDANEDSNLQNQQIENMILQGVDVIVVVPYDGIESAKIIEKAHEQGIKIIAYDRMIQSPDLDYYLSFDNVKVGEYQAQGVLDKVSSGKFAYVGGSEKDNNAFLLKQGSMSLLSKKIEEGEIEIVYDEFTEAWDPLIAYEKFNSYLEEGGEVDAVIAANDGTASGVIQALEEHGLENIPISGQDASLAACQYIVEGKQTLTVYKPLKNIAYKAAEMAVDISSGREITGLQMVENQFNEIPSILLDVVKVTKENMMGTVIKDGFQTYDEVYINIPLDERP